MDTLDENLLLVLRSLGYDHIADIVARRNRALDTNPPIADNNITRRGSNWLWAVAALHGFLFLVVLFLTMKTRHRQRVFHYIALALLLIPTIEYFTMASDLGGTAVPVQFRRGATRQVFWARYIEWTIVWSLIVLALLLMTAVGWSTVIWTIFLTILYAVMLLCGALTSTSYKWGYFVFALVAYFLVAWQLLKVARSWALRYETSKWYFPAAAYIVFFWALYPICWGLSEGGNVIANDSECVFYGILDIFSKGLFALGLVFLAKKLDYKRLGLWMHDHGRIAPGYATDYHGEKLRTGAAGAPPRDSGIGYGDAGYNGTRSGTRTTEPATTTAV